MLQTRSYILFLILEILTVPLVITIFKAVEPRKTAAVLAGSLFVSLGSFLLVKSFRAKQSLTLYAALAHLLLFSIPMLSKRIYYWSSDFSEITFYGIGGTDFHKISEYAFTVLFLATLIDGARTKFNKPLF